MPLSDSSLSLRIQEHGMAGSKNFAPRTLRAPNCPGIHCGQSSAFLYKPVVLHYYIRLNV